MCRQQLGGVILRPRGQGFDALSGWAPRVSRGRESLSAEWVIAKLIPAGRSLGSFCQNTNH
jgi:hypothetical protein